jgi:transposase-like protein
LAATTGLKLGHTASRSALALPKILLALSAGLTQEQAAKAVGINRTTLHRWREAMPEFAANVDAAREHARQEALERLRAAGKQDWKAISEWLRLSFAEYRTGNGPSVNVNTNVAAVVIGSEKRKELQERLARLNASTVDQRLLSVNDREDVNA